MGDFTRKGRLRLYGRFLKIAFQGGWGWIGSISTVLGIVGPIMAHLWPDSNSAVVLLAAFIPFGVLVACLIIGPLVGVLRAYQEKENELAKKQQELEDLRNAPSRTALDAAKNIRRREIERWLETGELLLSAIGAEIKDQPGPFLSAELVGRAHSWTTGADDYAQVNCADFLEKFRSAAGMPPMPAVDHRHLTLNEVYRRVERFKELLLRLEVEK